MSGLSFCLFGKFNGKNDNYIVKMPGHKLQELLGYLLIYRNRPHPREVLAEIIWGESQTGKNKKYLRQTLWLLHNILDPLTNSSDQPMLLIDPDWVQINCQAGYWLDVADFEEIAVKTQNKTGRQVDADCANSLERAARLYVGDLLEGNYQEWCFFERERLQNIYLMMLDKLVCYYYHTGLYEKGLMFAYKILAIDCTHEKSHRQIMRFHYLRGNRTTALKQYARCVELLKNELQVGPDKRTIALYEQLRKDAYKISVHAEEEEMNQLNSSLRIPLSGTVTKLKKLDAIIIKIQKELRKELEIVESSLNS